MRTHARPFFAALALFFALTSACNKSNRNKTAHDNADLSQVVAKVDDSVITVGDLQELINKQSPFIRARYTTLEKKKEFLDNRIRFEVMAKEAQRRGYDKDPEVLRVMKQQMISKFLQKDFDSKLKVEDVPDADVEKYYKEHPEEFNKKDEVRVSEIVVKDKAKADKVYAEAKATPKGAAAPGAFDGNKAFRDLVAKYSEDDASKQRGGDLTFFDKDSTVYPRPVVDAAFKMTEIGEISPPVKIDKGWAVLRLSQKRPGFSRPLAEVKRQIQQRLFRDMRTKSLDTFIADMKKKSDVEIHDDNLAKVVIDTGTGSEGAPAGMSAGGPPHGMMSPGAPPAGTPSPRPVPQGHP
jgi:peptidyl-prolyl cis-trans isomerase C